MPPRNRQSRSASVRTSILLALGGLLVFLLSGQERLHSTDSSTFVVLLQYGNLGDYKRHVAFLPFVGLVLRCLEPFGVGAFKAIEIASSLGTAAAMFALHRAAVLLAPAGGSPLLLPIAVATTPAVFYFATTAEVHGVFMAGVGVAFLAFAHWRERPSAGTAAWLGAACGFAATLHALGWLLPLQFLATAAALRCWPDRLPAKALAAAAGFAAAALGVSLLLGGGALAQVNDATHFLAHWATRARFEQLPALLWSEWFVPMAPWSVLALVAWARPRSRPWALAALLGLLVHLPMGILLLGPQTYGSEVGAYHLPATVPAVMAGLTLLPLRLSWGAIGLGTALTAWIVAPTLCSSCPPEFVEGVQQLRAERPFTLLVDWPELEGVRMHVARQPCFEVKVLLELFGPSGKDGEPTLAQWFDACSGVVNAQGAPYLITDAASRRLAESTHPDVRELLSTHVPAAYSVERVTRVGLHGRLLLPR